MSAALGSQQPWRRHKEKVFKQTQSRQNKTLEIEVFKMENLCLERTPQKCLILGTHFKNAFHASGDDTAGLCKHEDRALNTKTQACQHAPIIPALGARDRQVLRACCAAALIKTGETFPIREENLSQGNNAENDRRRHTRDMGEFKKWAKRSCKVDSAVKSTACPPSRGHRFISTTHVAAHNHF